MHIIKVWGLPAKDWAETRDHRKLKDVIIDAVINVKDFELSFDKITIFLALDAGNFRPVPATEIIVEMDGIFPGDKRTSDSYKKLIENVGKAVHKLCPNSRVGVFLRTCDPRFGYWCSDPPKAELNLA